MCIQGQAQRLGFVLHRRGLTGSASRPPPPPPPTLRLAPTFSLELPPQQPLGSPLCPLQGDRWEGELRVPVGEEGWTRGPQTGAEPSAWPTLQHLPCLLGKKRTAISLAVIKQLGRNQIIPRTEKPINKGATKTNRTAGAAGNTEKTQTGLGGWRLSGEGWALGCDV